VLSDIKHYKEKRDFSRTPEPAGTDARTDAPETARRFVVQKHAARRTHFDFRLEIGDALVSWAVPKGPSADPDTKRLAVHVEDHPLEYGDFEGNIPKGEYGAGAVIIWDRGRYQPVGETPDSDEALAQGVRDGKLDFVLDGERMRGRWTLVRMKTSDAADNWLLIKKKDLHAEPGRPDGLVERFQDSVLSGRTVEDQSLAPPDRDSDERGAPPVDIRPMLAQRGEAMPEGEAWCFELKLDGVRAIGWARPSGTVKLFSRRGQRLDPTFPEISEAMELLARRAGCEFVVDGEIIAAKAGEAASFGDLQPRLNLRDPAEITRQARAQPAEMFLFDVLWLDGQDLRDLALSDRKDRLRPLLRLAGHRLHYVTHDVASGGAMADRARREDYEGVVAKRLKSRYRSGERTEDWLKVKELARQEFVVCGWTDPQGGRQGFGALLLGYHDQPGGQLRYAGRVGTGFNDKTLRSISGKLALLSQDERPFETIPDDVQEAHWVEPELVAEVKFLEWTREGRLRQPVFLGLRSDIEAALVSKEGRTEAIQGPSVEPTEQARSLIRALEALEMEGRDGDLDVDGRRLKVTNLQKVFWPDIGATKGELLRYYVSVAPAILPVVNGRPLTLERYPSGVAGEMFYQQRVLGSVPEGVRTVVLNLEGEEVERVIGGDLYTLLYTAQLAAISQHIWPSRFGTLEDIDYTILDLDPGDGVPFAAVREAALAVRQQLQRLGIRGYPKTSGASGIHVVVPLQPDTSYETGRLLAELVANLVTRSHPDLATVQRAVSKRGARVYLDFLQNRRGATVASAYSVRPRAGATISAPLSWKELEQEIIPEDFTLRTMTARLATVGDLWSACRSDANDVREVLELL
jgi:bifunctional non-homologous end joining protein LigD